MSELKLEGYGEAGSGTPTGVAASTPGDTHRIWSEAPLNQRVVATSPDCIKILDTAGRVITMNEAGQRLMEIEDLTKVQGVAWSSLWPDTMRAEVDRAVDVAHGGGVSRFSGICPTGTGRLRWWDVVVNPFKENDGTVSWLIAISRDVTEAKEVEQKLIISEQRFRALTDNMAQLAWMTDASGAVFWYNKRWYEYTGASESEILGWGWRAHHHPDHEERVVRRLTEHFASGEPWEDTFPLRGANGEYRWFLSRARPIHDETTGKIALWCGTNTDITEQRNAGARLRQMARLIELSHEAILVWDLQDGIVLWNEGCEELYGFSRTEAVGNKSHDLLRTVHPMGTPAFLKRLIEDGEWAGELQHVAKDGSTVWVDSRQELIRFGERSVVLETNRDITERRRADATRDLLIAELNHRVKNTLAVVQSIATQTARSRPDPKRFVAAFIDRLHALSAAHNLLNEADWKGVDLHTMITRLVDGGQTNSRLVLSGPPVTLTVQAALHLALIFHELASNARLHGALSGGEGHVDVHWALGGTPEAQVVDIEWRETGGPPVQPLREPGFGTLLITRSADLPGLKTHIAFDHHGVICRLSVALPGGDRAYFNPGRPAEPPSLGAVEAAKSRPAP